MTALGPIGDTRYRQATRSVVKANSSTIARPSPLAAVSVYPLHQLEGYPLGTFKEIEVAG